MKSGPNWKIVIFAIVVTIVEFMLLLAILGEWVVGTYKIIAWIIFGIILLAGVILAIVWLLNHLWAGKKGDGSLTFDECMKISQKVLFFDYGIPIVPGDVSKAQMIFNVKHPVFFRACRDALEEKWVFVGIRLDAVLDTVGKPDKMTVMIDSSLEDVYEAMLALSGDKKIQESISKVMLDEFGNPITTVSKRTNRPPEPIDFASDEFKNVDDTVSKNAGG